MKPLYLIDSSIYIFRAWHLMPATIKSSDQAPANAVFGFTEFLLQILSTETPRYLICAFDESQASSERKRIFPDYKANRPAAPEALKNQFRWCRRFADAMGIRCFASTTYEADDIIGTLARQNSERGGRNIIISADKDLAQFIDQNDIFWDFAAKRRLGYRDVVKRYQITPEQLPDMLALAGDKVDNIPGVPGIGFHTAARLLYKWGNLNNLYNHLPEAAQMKFRGAQRASQLIGEYREQVFESRRLTGLMIVNHLPKQLEELSLTPVKTDELESLFLHFGFSSTRKKRWLKILSRHKTLI